MKDATIQIRTNQEKVKELKEIANSLDISVSQIIREAIRDKVIKLKKRDLSLKTASTDVAD